MLIEICLPFPAPFFCGRLILQQALHECLADLDTSNPQRPALPLSNPKRRAPLFQEAPGKAQAWLGHVTHSFLKQSLWLWLARPGFCVWSCSQRMQSAPWKKLDCFGLNHRRGHGYWANMHLRKAKREEERDRGQEIRYLKIRRGWGWLSVWWQHFEMVRPKRKCVLSPGRVPAHQTSPCPKRGMDTELLHHSALNIRTLSSTKCGQMTNDWRGLIFEPWSSAQS